MKHRFVCLYSLILIFSSFAVGQINNDFIVPHINIGRGLGEMHEISQTYGFGYDIGYDIPNSSFGVSGFYNFNRIGKVKETLPMYRDKYGIEDVDVVNISRIHSYGIKLRFTPDRLQYSRFVPYTELGIGRAHYISLWRSQVSQPSLDFYHLYYEDYMDTYKQREVLHKETTLFLVGEVGILIRLYAELDSNAARRKAQNRNGWYLGVSLRLETGGEVSFRNPQHNTDHFYFDSELGTFADNPFTTQSFPFDENKTFGTAPHRFLFFQISLMRVLF
jgi:hypothetical protein